MKVEVNIEEGNIVVFTVNGKKMSNISVLDKSFTAYLSFTVKDHKGAESSIKICEI